MKKKHIIKIFKKKLKSTKNVKRVWRMWRGCMKCDGIRNEKTKFSYPFNISCTILTFFVPSPTFEYFNLLILTHLTLINHIIKKYELKARTIGTHRRTDSLRIKFWNWFNISLQRVNYTLVPYVYYNKTPNTWVCVLLSIACKLSMNRCL